MIYREYSPEAALRGVVERFWTLETNGSAVQRVAPDGRPELIVNLGQPFEALVDGQWRLQPRSFFCGQIVGPLLLRPSGPAKILGVRFQPHGAACVFGPEMRDLAGRFTVVAESPARLLRAAKPADRAMAEAARLLAEARDVTEVAKHVGLSCRQLERRFLSRVGMPPKLFARIQRFQRVFRVIEGGRPDWAAAAVECGYYDQAHLIRDFRDFTGETPAALVAGDELAVAFLQYKRGASR